jgi:type I restriction enzyme S subunit
VIEMSIKDSERLDEENRATQGWKFIALEELVDLQRGHDLPDPQRKPGRVPILGSFGITGYHDESKAKGPGVTIGRSGSSFGIVSYSPVDYWPLNTVLYVTDFKGNDEKFVYYFLKSIDFAGFNSGSAQPSLNRNYIYPILIKIPPLPEQRAIARILSSLDDKIEANRCMNETLEAMARAIFKSWFVDFDPVRARAEGRAPAGMDAETAALFPDGFEEKEGRRVPMRWRLTTLADAIEIHDSKRIPLSNRERANRHGPYPYYGAASVMDYLDDFLFDGKYVLLGEDGSVVNKDGTPTIQYVWGKFWVNNHAMCLQVKMVLA